MKRAAKDQDGDVPEAKQRVIATGTFDGRSFCTLLRKRSTTLSELLAYFITALEKFEAGLTVVDPVVEFLKNTLGGEELIQYLDDEVSELELRFLFDVLERIFSRLDDSGGSDAGSDAFRRVGLHILDELLNHVDIVYEQLGCYHNASVRQTITMLVAATSVGPAAVSCLVQKFDLSHYKVMRLFSKSICVNELMSLFTILLLRGNDDAVAKMMDYAPTLQSLMLNLRSVPSGLAVSGFLAALKDRVLMNSLISTITKVKLFNRAVLRSLCSLLKQERKSVLSYLPAVKTFLSCYVEYAHFDDHSCGLSDRNKNPCLSHLFRMVVESFHFDQIRDVCIEILRLCPDQLQHCADVCSHMVKSGLASRVNSLLQEFFSLTLPSFGIFLRTMQHPDVAVVIDVAVPPWIYKTLLSSSLKSFKSESFVVGCRLVVLLLRRALLALDSLSAPDDLIKSGSKLSNNFASFNELIDACNHARQIFSADKSVEALKIVAVDVMTLAIRVYGKCVPFLLNSIDFAALYRNFEGMMELDAKLDFIELMFGADRVASSSLFDFHWFVRCDKSGSVFGRLLWLFNASSSATIQHLEGIFERVLLSLFDRNIFLQPYRMELYLWLNNFALCRSSDDRSVVDFFAQVVSVAFCNPFQKFDVLLEKAGIIDFKTCLVRLSDDNQPLMVASNDSIMPQFSIMTLIALEAYRSCPTTAADKRVKRALHAQLQSILVLQRKDDAPFVKLLRCYSDLKLVRKLLDGYFSLPVPKSSGTCYCAVKEFQKAGFSHATDFFHELCCTRECRGNRCATLVADCVRSADSSVLQGALNVMLVVLHLLKIYARGNPHACEVLSAALAALLGPKPSPVVIAYVLQDKCVRKRFLDNDHLLLLVHKLFDFRSDDADDCARSYVSKAVAALGKKNRHRALDFLVHFSHLLDVHLLTTVLQLVLQPEWQKDGFVPEVNRKINVLLTVYLDMVAKDDGVMQVPRSLVDLVVQTTLRSHCVELIRTLSRYGKQLRVGEEKNAYRDELLSVLQLLIDGQWPEMCFLMEALNVFPGFVEIFCDWCLAHCDVVKSHKQFLLPVFAQCADRWPALLAKLVFRLYKKLLIQSADHLNGEDIIKLVGALFQRGLVAEEVVSRLCCDWVTSSSLLSKHNSLVRLVDEIFSADGAVCGPLFVRLVMRCITETKEVTKFELKLMDCLAQKCVSLLASLDDENLKRFVMATLARRFFSSSHLLCLAKMVEECSDRFERVPLVAMIYGHSEFARHFVQDADPDVKTAIARLLFICAAKSSPQELLSSHVPVILSSYGAELSEADVYLLKLLHVYERHGVDLSAFYPFVWGPRGLDCYASLKVLGHSLWNRPSPNEVLDILDAKKMQKTIAECPTSLNFDVMAPSSLFVPGIYDPRFLLFVFSTLLKQESVVSCRRFVEKSCLALLFTSLSFHDYHLRALGYYLLMQFCELRNSERFVEREQLVYLVSLLRRSVTRVNQRLSYVIALFFGRVSLMLLYPADPLYSVVNKYMLYYPSINLDQVPDFKKICYSSSENCQQERHWMLNLLVDGVKEMKDYVILRNQSVFQMLLCYYENKLCRPSTKVLILRLLYATCDIQSAAYDMCANMNILAWIYAVSKGEKDMTCLSLLMKILDCLSAKHLNGLMLRYASGISRYCKQCICKVENKSGQV